MAKKVLVVDDESNIVDILRFNLQREGYEVLAAYDGQEGLEKARNEGPDLILLDVMLPLMDGFQVCEELRKTDRLTPIIMLTAREEERDRVMGLELGADDYVVKPFSVRELLARVRTNIRRTAVMTGSPRIRRGSSPACGQAHRGPGPAGRAEGRAERGREPAGIRAAAPPGRPRGHRVLHGAGPQRGPEAIRRRSLQILESLMARRFRAAE